MPTRPRDRHRHSRSRGLPRNLAQLPFASVLVVAALGILRIVQYHWRGGATLLGLSLLLAAVLRGVLRDEQAGLLAVRGKGTDVLGYAGLGVLVIAVALTIVGGPFA